MGISLKPSDFIVCESTAAITTHLREIKDIAPNYGGHVERPLSLCGASIAWDTKLPFDSARCTKCKEELPKLLMDFRKNESNKI